METEKIPLEIRKNNDSYWKHEELDTDKEVFTTYLNNYAQAFAKTKWYRFGSSSGKIIIERMTYGELYEFLKKIEGLKELNKSILSLNPHLKENGIENIGRTALFSLHTYIMENYKEVVDQSILKENGMNDYPKSEKMETKTCQYEGKEVVFFDFYQACYGESDIYAVPVEVAERLNLEDYDGEEISRYEDFLEEIEKYKVKEDMVVKASRIKAFNYD